MTLPDPFAHDHRLPAADPQSGIAKAVREDGGDGGLRLAIHDASRLEWSFAVPLPGVEDKPAPYTLVAELLVPSNTFVPHSPWDQLQTYTRLDGAASLTVDRHLTSVDTLRRETVAHAAALADASRLFARHCRLAGSLFAMAPHSDLEGSLRDALAAAAEIAAATRGDRRVEPEDIRRERLLADEWISVRYVELLASAERSLGSVLDSRTPHLPEVQPAIERLQDEVGGALAAEIEHRRACGYLHVDGREGPEAAQALERYLDRASGLKKHFQEVLFLETETRRPAETIQLWARVVATLLAGTLAFFLQLELTLHATRSSEVGSGLTALAVVAGLSYAARDRFKESGREWLAGKMARFYAQRVTVLRLPSRRSQRQRIVAVARESVQESRVRVPDPLALEGGYGGATLPVTSVKYVHRAVVRPQTDLRAEGSSRVKHVFRYDLSPLFARLDDPIKKLPILEPGSRRVRFTDAPRCYRMQVRLSLTRAGVTHTELQTVVMSKRGLERLEEGATAREVR